MDNCQWNSFTVWAKYVSLVPPFINRMVEIVLVAYLHDCDRFVCDVEKFLRYELKTVRAWEARDGKMIFYILPRKRKKVNP